jgi:chemotaxis protein methyltransferase CheR
MVAHDALAGHPGVTLKILATDLSVQMLSQAKLGLYESHKVGTVPPQYKNKYLRKVRQDDQVCLQVVPELRRLITFSRFNLMSPTFPFRHGFDIVFCRNVMIYFDRPTQQALVNRFAAHLNRGGYLMIGHSESLNGTEHPLAYVEPTVYRKD